MIEYRPLLIYMISIKKKKSAIVVNLFLLIFNYKKGRNFKNSFTEIIKNTFY